MPEGCHTHLLDSRSAVDLISVEPTRGRNDPIIHKRSYQKLRSVEIQCNFSVYALAVQRRQTLVEQIHKRAHIYTRTHPRTRGFLMSNLQMGMSTPLKMSMLVVVELRRPGSSAIYRSKVGPFNGLLLSFRLLNAV